MPNLTIKPSIAFIYVSFAAFGKHTSLQFMPHCSSHVTPALLFFDTFLALPLEIKYIWHRKTTLGSILYMLARYPALISILGIIYLDVTYPALQVREFSAFVFTLDSLTYADKPLKNLAFRESCNAVFKLISALDFLPRVGVHGDTNYFSVRKRR